jgi:hypothetical protein
MESTRSQIISILAQLRTAHGSSYASTHSIDTAVNTLDQLVTTKCAETYELGYADAKKDAELHIAKAYGSIISISYADAKKEQRTVCSGVHTPNSHIARHK